jgi:hypothetical protein
MSVRVKEKGKKSTKKVNEHDKGSERLRGRVLMKKDINRDNKTMKKQNV